MREKIFLAALLHDIGKFYQRADDQLLKNHLTNDPHLETVARMICHENEYGRFGYQHVVWTYKFMLENEQLFNDIKNDKGETLFKVSKFNNEDGMDNLINLAIFHHKPNTELQGIIQLADWISSGMERSSQNIEKEDGDLGKFAYKKQPLKNIFNIIQLSSEQSSRESTAYPLKPLDIGREVFPKETNYEQLKSQGLEEASGLYKALWEGFTEECQSIACDSYDSFIESLLAVLRKYTWSIPASTQDLQHVSLYEHLRTTAAIAQSLFDYREEYPEALRKNNHRLSIEEGTHPLLLSCWDLSGIQKFIYNIAGRKAAMSLKGRSFYLNLLVQDVIESVCRECNLSEGNVIYSSGGKVFFLMANTSANRKTLESLHSSYEKALFEKHSQSLYLCHGFAGFTYEIGSGKPIKIEGSTESVDLSELWKQVIQKSAATKSKKYISLLKENFVDFFEPKGSWGSDFEVCAVTGKSGQKVKDLHKLPSGNDVWVAKEVLEQISIGEELKDADYVLSFYGEERLPGIKSKKGLQFHSLPGSKASHLLLSRANLNSEFVASSNHVKVKALNSTDAAEKHFLKGKNLSYSTLFYGGNEQALSADKKRNKTFEELADDSLLGVLRMDVDGLGAIFQRGIPDPMRSFATYAMLSNHLDWFFSGYLNTIRNSEKYKDDVNILYSGGDDVFAVGKWDKLIHFAEDIREEFRQYTGNHPQISISAGISMVGSKYPIRKAADQAGEAENASKRYQSIVGNETKNAITMFGISVNWNEEWQEVKALRDQLIALGEQTDGKISKALLHRLKLWYNQKLDYDQGKGSLSFKWITAYYLKRYSDKYDNKKESHRSVIEFLDQLHKSLFTGVSFNGKYKFGNEYYKIAALAARWTELTMKSN